ncbi:CDP-alcohol phosphatidyltransferase family protein [Parabacteroides sp. FAFU027]|uniref:CDP-alcohol phosphatidyltransferase family protein n=1 Tax=Parabacteroides sp. FAFU027 TaxID=2922715 RepID=UPI001FAFB8B6|nr:CDP-alcohol phosphatidyltransferase family protein [Parabacteroides sp. FAFU027]
MAQNSTEKITLESSLKSLEIENFLDRYFYRPVAFQIALLLRHTPATPNMVTVLSIFVGIAAGTRFYFDDIWTNITGILLLILANTLDCVDGQLARLTGIKSKIGRILDGFAGDLWFATIYIAICLRTMNEGAPVYIFALAIFSGYSHSRQAAIADYFKNIHLFFLKGTAGSELDDAETLQQKYLALSWKNDFWEKLFKFFYRFYTRGQEKLTPEIQKMRKTIASRYNNNISEELKSGFRTESTGIIFWMHSLSFNTRSLFLFGFTLIGHPWYYFIFEIVALNLALLTGLKRYEQVCKTINENILAGKYDKR